MRLLSLPVVGVVVGGIGIGSEIVGDGVFVEIGAAVGVGIVGNGEVEFTEDCDGIICGTVIMGTISIISTLLEYGEKLITPPPKNILFWDDADASQ